MKKLFLALFVALSSTLAAQNLDITTRQGYLLIDSSATIFTDVDYSFQLTKDSVFLPNRSLSILHKEPVYISNKHFLKLQLSDGSDLYYTKDQELGNIVSIVYRNGRWVMWEKVLAGFSFVMPEKN